MKTQLHAYTDLAQLVLFDVGALEAAGSNGRLQTLIDHQSAIVIDTRTDGSFVVELTIDENGASVAPPYRPMPMAEGTLRVRSQLGLCGAEQLDLPRHEIIREGTCCCVGLGVYTAQVFENAEQLFVKGAISFNTTGCIAIVVYAAAAVGLMLLGAFMFHWMALIGLAMIGALLVALEWRHRRVKERSIVDYFVVLRTSGP